MRSATLVLEDGTAMEGQAFGAETDSVFELVFNTSMSGYQERTINYSRRARLTFQAVFCFCSEDFRQSNCGICKAVER